MENERLADSGNCNLNLPNIYFLRTGKSLSRQKNHYLQQKEILVYKAVRGTDPSGCNDNRPMKILDSYRGKIFWEKLQNQEIFFTVTSS